MRTGQRSRSQETMVSPKPEESISKRKKWAAVLNAAEPMSLMITEKGPLDGGTRETHEFKKPNPECGGFWNNDHISSKKICSKTKKKKEKKMDR